MSEHTIVWLVSAVFFLCGMLALYYADRSAERAKRDLRTVVEEREEISRKWAEIFGKREQTAIMKVAREISEECSKLFLEAAEKVAQAKPAKPPRLRNAAGRFVARGSK